MRGSCRPSGSSCQSRLAGRAGPRVKGGVSLSCQWQRPVPTRRRRIKSITSGSSGKVGGTVRRLALSSNRPMVVSSGCTNAAVEVARVSMPYLRGCP